MLAGVGSLPARHAMRAVVTFRPAILFVVNPQDEDEQDEEDARQLRAVARGTPLQQAGGSGGAAKRKVGCLQLGGRLWMGD